MASGLYAPTFRAALNGGIALNLTATTHKFAWFSASINPNFGTDTAYGVGEYAANEVTGTGWSAGGVALSAAGAGGTSTAPTLATSADGITYAMQTMAVSGATLTGIRYLMLYADALAGNNAIALVDFGDSYDCYGLLQVPWSSSGVFTWSMF